MDSSKINFLKKDKVYRKKISYVNNLKPTQVVGVDAEREDAAQAFVIKNRNNLFFRKHWHWNHENEYRMVSKVCNVLDISEAITHVYILGEDDVTLQSIRSIVGNTRMISCLNVSGLNGLSLSPMLLYDKEELEEELKSINKYHVDIWNKKEWTIPKF